jgi:hypothetical protein
LTGVDLPDEPGRTYNFDSYGRLETIDANGKTPAISYTYDYLNRVASVTDLTVFESQGKAVSYTYYKSGLRKTMTVDSQYSLSYEYDNALRLDLLYRDSVKLADYDYNALGQRTDLTRYTGGTTEVLHTDYEYAHPLKWLTYLENREHVAAGDVISSFRYYPETGTPEDGFDKVGNRKYIERVQGETTHQLRYEYDEVYQLVEEARTNSENL